MDEDDRKPRRPVASVIIADGYPWLVLVIAVLTSIIFPIYAKWREWPREEKCLSSVKAITSAAFMYAQDHGDRLPPPDAWNNALFQPYMLSYPICPDADTKLTTYALNGLLKKLELSKIGNRKDTVFVFESKPGADLCGGRELMSQVPRHSGGDNIAFLDGHAQWVKRSDARKYMWDLSSRQGSSSD